MINQSPKIVVGASSNCFVYGTLMSPEVLQTLIGRVPQMESPAYLPQGYTRHPVIGQVYPGVIRDCNIEQSSPLLIWTEIQNTCTEGILLRNLNPTEMQIFDWFEDLDYTKTNVPVYLQGQKDALTENTDVYIWSAGEEKLDLESSWSYEKFRQEKLNWFLEATVGPCRTAIDRIDFSAE